MRRMPPGPLFGCSPGCAYLADVPIATPAYAQPPAVGARRQQLEHLGPMQSSAYLRCPAGLAKRPQHPMPQDCLRAWMEEPEHQPVPSPPNAQAGPQQKSLLSRQVLARGLSTKSKLRAASVVVAWKAVRMGRSHPEEPTNRGDSVHGGPDIPRTATTSRRGDFEALSLARSIAKRSGTTIRNPPLLPEPLDGPDVACTGSPITAGCPCLELEVVLACSVSIEETDAILRLNRWVWLITCLLRCRRDQRGYKGGTRPTPFGAGFPMVVSQQSWRYSVRSGPSRA